MNNNINKVDYAKECTLQNIGKVLIPDNETSNLWDSWELDVMNTILTRTNKDTVFIDIGANWGYFSLSVATKAKRVFSIEPNPLVYNMLYNNSLRFSNIETYRMALSDKVSKMKFYYRPGVWETGMLFPPRPDDNNFFYSPEIDIETLSSFQKRYINYIEDNGNILIKMDCEGSEFHILRDIEFFKDNIRNNVKCTIVLELHKSVIETERNFGFPEFVQFLDNNFNLYSLSGDRYDIYNMGDIGRGFIVLEPKD
jgi:FkbM family methyltransferase